MRDVQDDLEVRPGFGTGLIVLTVIAVSGVGLVAAILIGDAPSVFAPIVGAFWVVMLILGAVGFLTSGITLTSHEVVVRRPFSRKRWSRSRVTKAVRATIHTPKGAPGETVFLLDAHGRPLTRVNVGYYKREDVDRLVKMLGVPCSGPDYFASAKEFAKTYPGMVPWAERHPLLIAFPITVVLLAVIMAVVIAGLRI